MMKIYKISLVKCLALTLLATSSFVVTNAQDDGSSKKYKSFEEMRKMEFSKLIGGPTQNGVNINYNNEKAAIEGAGTFAGKKENNHLFQVKGSIGTSTNLSELFSQKVLPSFSGSFTWNLLITGKLSRWFYDGRLASNFNELEKGTKNVRNIVTEAPFTYTNAFKKKIQDGKIKKNDTVHSHKRLSWLSLTGKYENTKYSFYDANRIFAEQLNEPIYQSWTAKIALNRYFAWNKEDFKWKNRLGWRPNFIYYNIALQYGLGNNIQQLKKKTVNDVSATQAEGGVTRQTVKSNSAYTGTYREFNTLTSSFDAIAAPIKSFAVNAFGEYNMISSKDKTRYGLANYGSIAVGGYYYGTETIKINIGLYYKWTRDNATKTWTEQIGLRTTIPITPN